MKYDYRCKSCEQTYIKEHLMCEDPEFECDACSGPLEKYFGDPDVNIYYKGFGWVSVDSRIIHTASDVHGDLGI